SPIFTVVSKISKYVIATETPCKYNAALRCEQRYHETKPIRLKHKTQRWNEKCQALGITLKCLVIFVIQW
ncbi:hypothetical protein P3568_23345, partial [Vibrio parahaemolyticus]|nr:hypothetical protein [Vibrio parahaemolyticus]MDG2565735.1 hypothetical protein [Vibrio parahaemolyticus]MDG2614511.1 hypothetical protein [Vibrio parahaemolyticus]